MEELILSFAENLPTVVLFLVILGSLFLLGKGADILVDEAVALSGIWGIPKVLIGATIVSLGTTLPEAAVSVMAAVQGNPGLALGNAVGSIICDTGLIIGIAALISPLTLDKKLVNRQGWLQLGAGALLIAVSLPLFSGAGAAAPTMPQAAGFVFIILLALYMVITVRWSRNSGATADEEVSEKPESSSSLILIIKLAAGVALIIISSKILIPSVEITAVRIGIPQSIIAATLVAFGTSLPELVTAISAARRGHGDLAIGNVIGADILNVLFVAGAAAAVTPRGLAVPDTFFRLQFPAMMIILLTFRLITFFASSRIRRWHGLLLLAMYAAYTLISYLIV